MKVIPERDYPFLNFKVICISNNVILQYPIDIYIFLNLYDEFALIVYNGSTVILYSFYNF